VVLNDNRRPLIFDRVCRFMATNTIEFHAFVDGLNPLQHYPRYMRFGRAKFGLTGDNFSYEILMPQRYGPYGAFIRFMDPIFSHDVGIIANLETVDCLPTASTNEPADAAGLEFLPQCVIRGAVCLSPFQTLLILSGASSFLLGPPGNPEFEWAIIVPDDSDHDGVPDYLDHCPNTPTNSVINAQGCSITDLCPCDGPWRNHGEYLNGLKSVTGRFVSDGLLTGSQQQAILRQSAASDCGKPRR
jgi:hypothetical protein